MRAVPGCGQSRLVRPGRHGIDDHDLAVGTRQHGAPADLATQRLRQLVEELVAPEQTGRVEFDHQEVMPGEGHHSAAGVRTDEHPGARPGPVVREHTTLVGDEIRLTEMQQHVFAAALARHEPGLLLFLDDAAAFQEKVFGRRDDNAAGRHGTEQRGQQRRDRQAAASASAERPQGHGRPPAVSLRPSCPAPPGCADARRRNRRTRAPGWKSRSARSACRRRRATPARSGTSGPSRRC